MNRLVVIIASALTAGAVLLATQAQTFSRVDAGGPKLRMLIAGSGSPAVVFDTGGAGSLELWGRVPSDVSRFTTAVSYDRAGNGLSDKATTPRDARHIAIELHTALHNTRAAPPYILVGHSVGGPYIRVFAGMYPDEVAGMVLIDPTQEEMFAWDREDGLRPSDEEACRLDGDERECADATLAQARESAVPPNTPVWLIHVMWPWLHGPFSSTELEEVVKAQIPRAPLRLKFHQEWINKVPGGQLVITENSSHGGINLEEPQLVVRTIREAVEKARSRNKAARAN